MSVGLFNLLIASGTDQTQLLRFLELARQTPLRSIDAFLETRQDDEALIRVGRAVIAATMGEALLAARGESPDSRTDWLDYLIVDKMRPGAATVEEFATLNSGVTFVTFNFDSIVEDKLASYAARIYGASEAQTQKVLSAVKVIHLHGKLPETPKSPKMYSETDGGAVDIDWVQWLKSAPSTVNVVMDSIDEATRSAALTAVEHASILCFLGFSYQRDNLTRLGIAPDFAQRGCICYGSAKAMSEGDQAWVRSRFGEKILLAHISDDCVAALQRFHVFRD